MSDSLDKDAIALILRQIEHGVEQRHLDNQAWQAQMSDVMQKLVEEQKKTNGNIIRHDGRLIALERDVKRLFARLSQKVGGITKKDFTLWIAIAVGAYYFLTVVLGFHK